MHRAAVNGNEKIAALLLAAGAAVHARNAQGQTPLDLALDTRNDTAHKLLLLPDRKNVVALLEQHVSRP